MTYREIARNLASKTAHVPELKNMMNEIAQGQKTKENWFLWKVVKFIERENFDITDYQILSVCDNRESDPEAPVTHWLLHFMSNKMPKEFNLEVRNNRKIPVVVWQWTDKSRLGFRKHRLVRHIRDGLASC